MAGFVALFSGAVMPSVVQGIRAAFGRACAAIDGVAYVATSTAGDERSATIRVVCAVLAIAFLGIIVLRRHNMSD
jgi:hypothetical protein